MFRFYYTIVMRTGSILHYVPKMRRYAKHPEQYTEEDCHDLCCVMIDKVARTAHASTTYYGIENLPAEGGYILYSNHQGKYDALGIMRGHPRPCRVLMDKKRSEMPIANEYISLVRGKRIDAGNIRQQMQCIREIGEEVKEGKVYLIFPEGGYRKDQDNYMNRFRSGCFRSAMIAQCPIVPVAIIDSFKPFGERGLSHVQTEVHYLQPIPYEDYCGMKPAALAEMVQARIAACMEDVLGEKVWDDDAEMPGSVG